MRGYVQCGGMELDHSACYRAVSTRDTRFDGRIFTAVKTTGIYCRPVCPARTPLENNVEFYPSAAAAQEAGYRPCLRCRPETAPDLGAWKGTSNTVSRALNMIELGALDDGNVAHLAARLGVGDRHLRRLFAQHLGASPIAVAQTRRVLLAKQLIHDTNLSLAQVAMASGFGSIRRFNETFSALYNRPPSEMRRNEKDKAIQDAAAGDVVVQLNYRAPYDWPAMLKYFAARAIDGMEVVENGKYIRAISIGDQHGVVTISHFEGQSGSGQTGKIEARIRFPVLSALPQIIARLRRLLDLSTDPEIVGAHLSDDPFLKPLINKQLGLRAPGAWDGFELAIRAILGQQITIEAARKLGNGLVADYGEVLGSSTGVAGVTHAFPLARTLAGADLSGLRMPRARSGALKAMAQAVVDDPDLFSMRASLDETIKSLTNLKGIGDWTAQYIAMRAMQEADAFPAADAALINAFEKLTGERLKPKELQVVAQKWRPWRAYATQYLWASLAD